MGTQALPLTYFFSLNAKLDSTKPAPIEVAGGTRVQLGYSSDLGTVSTDGAKYNTSFGAALPAAAPSEATADEKSFIANLAEEKDRPGLVEKLTEIEARCRAALPAGGWAGLAGSVLSGSDSVFIRDDGTALLEGRLTIKAGNGFLIGVITSGVVDLRHAFSAAITGPEAYRAYLSGEKFPDQKLPVTLSVRFEVSTGPGAAALFAAGRYLVQTLNHWKYERLARSQFLAIGHITLTKQRHWPTERIELDFYEPAKQAQVG